MEDTNTTKPIYRNKIDFLGKTIVKTVDISVPEWDTLITLRSLSTRQVRDCRMAAQKFSDSGQEIMDNELFAVACFLESVDPRHGFAKADREALLDEPTGLFNRLLTAILDVSGLSEASRKNLLNR